MPSILVSVFVLILWSEITTCAPEFQRVTREEKDIPEDVIEPLSLASESGVLPEISHVSINEPSLTSSSPERVHIILPPHSGPSIPESPDAPITEGAPPPAPPKPLYPPTNYYIGTRPVHVESSNLRQDYEDYEDLLQQIQEMQQGGGAGGGQPPAGQQPTEQEINELLQQLQGITGAGTPPHIEYRPLITCIFNPASCQGIAGLPGLGGGGIGGLPGGLPGVPGLGGLGTPGLGNLAPGGGVGGGGLGGLGGFGGLGALLPGLLAAFGG